MMVFTFYAKHLQALKDAGIMNNISDPNATEMRGWVMLMLQRAAENVNPSECNDPAVLLACSLGSDSCPAACQKKADEKSEEEPTPSNISDMPVAGDLTIAVADYSSSIKSAPSKGTVVFNAVDFKASEKITIESVKLERTGLSDKSAIKWVWFEKDGVAVSAKASLSTDGTVTTRFYNNYSVNGTDTLDLVVELNGKAGAEIAFKFIGATTTAKNVSLSTETTTYRTTEYSVAVAEFAINGGNSGNVVEYKVGDTNSFEIGKFQITNNRPSGVSEDRDMIVKSIKLKNAESLDLADTFKNVYVTRDGKTVSKKVELDGKTMTIQFDDDKLASGKKGVYTIFAEVNQLNEVGRSVQLYLNKYTELVAYEVTSNFRVAYATNTDLYLKEYKFQGGKVTFANNSSMSKTVNAAAGSTDVVLAKGTLTISEPVRLNKIQFSTKDSVAVEKNQSTIIKDLKLEIGGSTYNTSATCTAGEYTCTYTTDDDEIYVSKTSDIRVLANLRGNAKENATVEFSKNLMGSSIQGTSHYDNSDEKLESKDIAGSIQLAKLTVKAGKFNLTNKSSSTKKVVINSSDEVVIFDGEISAKEGRVSVNDLTLTGEFGSTITGLKSSEQIDLTLYVDGEAFRTQTLRGTEKSKSFANLGDVESGKSMKIMIKAQPNMGTTGYIDFTVGAKGTDSNGNDVAATSVSASRLEITESATVTIASSNSESSVIRDGSNAEILSFTATAKDGSFDVNNLEIAWKGFGMLKNATLAIDGTDVDSTNAIVDTKITFDGLNETLKEGKHTFTVKANVSAKDTTSQSKLTVDSVKVNKTTKELNISKLVANSFPVITSSTSSNDLILTISNPSDSEDDIEILGFLVDGDVLNASIKDSSINLSNGTSLRTLIEAKNISIAAGEKVEFRMQAAKSATVQVKGIIIREDKQVLAINSDYTNVGKWSNFKVTANGDQDAKSFYRLTSVTTVDAEDTTIAGHGSSITNFTVTFNSNGGTAVASQSVASWDTIASAPTTTKTGYKNPVWKNGQTAFVFGTTKVTKNITLAAEWTVITYIIKYDKNDNAAAGTMNEVTATYDTTSVIDNAYTNAGKVFNWWNTAADGSGDPVSVWAKNLTDTDNDTVTLYAQWTGATA